MVILLYICLIRTRSLEVERVLQRLKANKFEPATISTRLAKRRGLDERPKIEEAVLNTTFHTHRGRCAFLCPCAPLLAF